MKCSSFLLSACLVMAPPLAAMAEVPTPARVEILPGWRTDEGIHVAALRVRLDPGWKTYWRAPGEAGIPPVFDWTGSENLGEVRFHWPVPEVFLSSGLTTIGYHDVLVLPMEVVPLDPDSDVTLAAEVQLGVCQDICMPMEARVTAVLDEATATSDAEIAAALANRPLSGAEAGLGALGCSVEPIADGLRVTARLELPAVTGEEIAVIEPADPAIWASEAIISREGAVLTASADLVPPEARPFALDTETLRLTVLAGGRAVDIAGCPATR